MVCTDRRLIYIETGRMAFSLLAFLRKVVACPYHEISNVQPGKRVGIYSGKVLMECNGRKMNYAMMDSKDAEEQLQECRCYTVEDLFCCGYARYFWEAIKIRYPEYCFYVDMEDLYAEN